MEDIIKHYEACLEKNKGTSKEVDWPTEEGANIRYKVMCEVAGGIQKIYSTSPTILDYGCGTASILPVCFPGGYFYYTGCDASAKMIKEAKKRYPKAEFFHSPFEKKLPKRTWDYIIANGVFTEKRNYTWMYMYNILENELRKLLQHTTKGIAFNIMNPHSLPPNTQREELFFMSYGSIDTMLRENLHITKYIIRADYLPYEYTVYAYKE